MGQGVYFLYYIIHFCRAITENEAYRLVHFARNEVPYGHPRWWAYISMSDRWVGDGNMRTTLPETEAGGWADDVSTASQAMGTNPGTSDNNAVAPVPQPASSGAWASPS